MNLSIKKLAKKAKSPITTLCQKVAALKAAPSERVAEVALIALGVSLISFAVLPDALARQGGSSGAEYNDLRIVNAVNMVMLYLEGSFGALVMAAAGIGAILSAAFGQYKAALSLMIVAIGAFILRSLMSTFFNDEGIQQ